MFSRFNDCLLIFSAKKQAEYEEEYTQRNAIHRLDNDEIDYLEGLLAKERATEARIKQEVTRGLDAFKQKRQAEELEELKDKTTATAEAAAATAAAVSFLPTKRRKKTVNNTRNSVVVSSATKKNAKIEISTKDKTITGQISNSTSTDSPKPSEISTSSTSESYPAQSDVIDNCATDRKENPKATGAILGLQYSDDDESDQT